MQVRIGVAHTSRVVEIESENPDQVRSSIEEAFERGDPLLWVEDSDGTRIGIPREMLAFVEFEGPVSGAGIGFAASG